MAVGFDRRFLSREAAVRASEVLAANGVNVLFINNDAPTPLVMFVVKRQKLSYGMAVTASHNPAIHNGIKLFVSGGRDADEATTDELEIILNKLDDADIMTKPFNEAIKEGCISIIKPQNEYLDSIIEILDMPAIRKKI